MPVPSLASGAVVTFDRSFVFPAVVGPPSSGYYFGLIQSPLPIAQLSYTLPSGITWDPNSSTYLRPVTTDFIYSVLVTQSMSDLGVVGTVLQLPESWLIPFVHDTIVHAYAESKASPSTSVLDVQNYVSVTN